MVGPSVVFLALAVMSAEVSGAHHPSDWALNSAVSHEGPSTSEDWPSEGGGQALALTFGEAEQPRERCVEIPRNFTLCHGIQVGLLLTK